MPVTTNQYCMAVIDELTSKTKNPKDSVMLCCFFMPSFTIDLHVRKIDQPIKGNGDD